MRKAIYKDKKLVAEILVSAFLGLKEDNSINFVIKPDKNRRKRMQVLMGYLFEKAFLFGEIYISDNEQACVLLKFPFNEKITFKTLKLDLKLVHKCIGYNRVFKVLKRQYLANKNYPKEKHIRPMLIGVRQNKKGNGSAARLMLEVKKAFKKNSLPVIIDTASIQNVKLYQKLGFKIIKKEDQLGFPIYFLQLN